MDDLRRDFDRVKASLWILLDRAIATVKSQGGLRKILEVQAKLHRQMELKGMYSNKALLLDLASIPLPMILF